MGSLSGLMTTDQNAKAKQDLINQFKLATLNIPSSAVHLPSGQLLSR